VKKVVQQDWKSMMQSHQALSKILEQIDGSRTMDRVLSKEEWEKIKYAGQMKHKTATISNFYQLMEETTCRKINSLES
jgi:hypothetical protein